MTEFLARLVTEPSLGIFLNLNESQVQQIQNWAEKSREQRRSISQLFTENRQLREELAKRTIEYSEYLAWQTDKRQRNTDMTRARLYELAQNSSFPSDKLRIVNLINSLNDELIRVRADFGGRDYILGKKKLEYFVTYRQLPVAGGGLQLRLINLTDDELAALKDAGYSDLAYDYLRRHILDQDSDLSNSSTRKIGMTITVVFGTDNRSAPSRFEISKTYNQQGYRYVAVCMEERYVNERILGKNVAKDLILDAHKVLCCNLFEIFNAVGRGNLVEKTIERIKKLSDQTPTN